MTGFPIRIGVDEIATETQKCDGFTFFCLPEAHVNDFTKQAASLLKAANLDGFHGREFRPEYAKPYQDFLSLAFGFLRQSPQSLAACRLFSANVKSKLADSCSRTVEISVGRTLGSKHASIPILQPYFSPLACLAAMSRELAPEVQMVVEMDSHTSLKDLNQTVHHELHVQIDAATLLRRLYNEYAQQLHARTPLLPENGVTVLDDEASIMVQAADVIGNFAMAHVFVTLGKETMGRKAKAQILRAVAGDELDAFDPTGKLTFSGNDLILSEEGAITFKVSWLVSKPPDNADLMEDWPEDDGFLGARRG